MALTHLCHAVDPYSATSKERNAVTKLLENTSVFVTVCALFVLALCTNVYAGGPIPAFDAGCVLLPDQPQISQGPVPPPDPKTPAMVLAQGPVPPPDPKTPAMTLAQGPVPPPDPKTPAMVLAQGPVPPPDPKTPLMRQV